MRALMRVGRVDARAHQPDPIVPAGAQCGLGVGTVVGIDVQFV